MFMWVASLTGRGEGTFFLANAIGLSALALVTAWLLFGMSGWRALRFALAPSLALYAFLNWDLLAVALATAGLSAFLRRRDKAAGALPGLGIAAKVYPIFVLGALCIDRLREGDRRGAVRLASAGAVTWVAMNAPFAVVEPARWSFFFRFSSSRAPTPGTLWHASCALAGRIACPSIPAINAISALVFVIGVVLVARAALRRDRPPPAWSLAFPVLVLFLLTSKVYSPQYALWLLPFFALVVPDFRLFALFAIADASVFLAEFSWIGAQQAGRLASAWPLALAVAFRAAVLVALLVAYLRRGATTVPELSAQTRVKTSPSASS